LYSFSKPHCGKSDALAVCARPLTDLRAITYTALGKYLPRLKRTQLYPDQEDARNHGNREHSEYKRNHDPYSNAFHDFFTAFDEFHALA
jgi:hypothetical protein